MIRNAYQDGWLLIPQPAHAWVSGQMALQWGNDQVDQPKPMRAVVLGTTLHDTGWMETDREPLLNPNGEPLNFIELQYEEARSLYPRGVSHAIYTDPYAGVLAGRHVQMIYRNRITFGRDPAEKIQPLLDDLEALEKRTIQQMTTHPTYSAFLDEDMLRHNYQILRTCDFLSLFLCGAIPARELSDVPLRYDEPFATIDCQWLDDETMQIEPYLFSEPQLSLNVTGRYLPQKTFADVEELRAMFRTADHVVLTRKIVKG